MNPSRFALLVSGLCIASGCGGMASSSSSTGDAGLTADAPTTDVADAGSEADAPTCTAGDLEAIASIDETLSRLEGYETLCETATTELGRAMATCVVDRATCDQGALTAQGATLFLNAELLKRVSCNAAVETTSPPSGATENVRTSAAKDFERTCEVATNVVALLPKIIAALSSTSGDAGAIDVGALIPLAGDVAAIGQGWVELRLLNAKVRSDLDAGPCKVQPVQ